MKFLIILNLFVLNLHAGGNEVGNGGDAVVCKSKDKIESVELLDFYEHRVQEGHEIIDDNSLEPIQQVQKILKHLNTLSPRLSAQYQKGLRSFMEKNSFVENAKLIDIEDSKHIVLPRNKDCTIQQIAIYNKNKKSSKEFVVDKTLWDQMNTTNQAGLILHELIYQHFSRLGEKDSIKARQINAFLFDKDFQKVTPSKFWSKIRKLKIPIYRK